jgi:heme/copper-type cytochrome/quinol oxidase subunit 4
MPKNYFFDITHLLLSMDFFLSILSMDLMNDVKACCKFSKFISFPFALMGFIVSLLMPTHLTKKKKEKMQVARDVSWKRNRQLALNDLGVFPFF